MVRAMRRYPRASHRFQRLKWFLAALLFSTCVAQVFAAGSVRVTPMSSRLQSPSSSASTWTEWGVSTTSSRGTTSLDAVVTATEFATTSGALSSKTIGSLARKALRGGVYGAAIGLAVEGIIDGAGWAIGELQDQVMDGPVRQPETAPPGTQMACTAEQQQRCVPLSTPMALCGAIMSISVHHTVCTSVRRDGSMLYYNVTPGGGTYGGVVRTFTTDQPIYGTGYQPNPVADEQLGDAIRREPQLVNDLLTDPRTGRPIMTPELQQQGDQLKREIEDREGIPTSGSTPDPDLEDDSPSSDTSPWPSFCGWASAVCTFFDWFKADDSDTSKPEVPWEDEDPSAVQQTWSSGLGGGSCPAPVSFSVSLGGTSASPEFSFAPVCQFGTLMRPVIIALAAIIAGFIIGGVRGTKDA